MVSIPLSASCFFCKISAQSKGSSFPTANSKYCFFKGLCLVFSSYVLIIRLTWCNSDLLIPSAHMLAYVFVCWI